MTVESRLVVSQDTKDGKDVTYAGRELDSLLHHENSRSIMTHLH